MKDKDTRLQMLFGDNGLPILKSPTGLSFTLTTADLETITELASTGHSPDFIAMRLGVAVKEFERARANCVQVENAIRAGIARDDADITKKIREEALNGSMIAAIHYSKSKLKWVTGEAEMKTEASKKNPISVNITINTGIDRTPIDITPVYDQPIEDNKNESLF